eukprot:TRINITY_DN15273_c0_g1_i1.p1 TRINITY_DN15273_c0_g1~~TRINITY_DN15273_c0_g1_i1.p1  ORF type:complete len:238 (-),score=56.13 TRINITY_DN15273_c0_g1_i1:51-764(-)
MVFLSFNPAITSPEDIADEQDEHDESERQEDLPLRQKWIVWQQRAASGSKNTPYGESTKQISEMKTLTDFWQIWDRLPQPSELLQRRMVFSDAGTDALQIGDALMLFRDGVLPEWEDAANAEGGHLQFQFKAAVGGAQIDEYWNNLVLGAVGGTIEPADRITGIRLVDKLSSTGSGGKGGAPGLLRMEVWFDSATDHGAMQELQRNIERCLATRTLEGRIATPPKAELKHHKMTRHQ